MGHTFCRVWTDQLLSWRWAPEMWSKPGWPAGEKMASACRKLVCICMPGESHSCKLCIRDVWKTLTPVPTPTQANDTDPLRSLKICWGTKQTKRKCRHLFLKAQACSMTADKTYFQGHGDSYPHCVNAPLVRACEHEQGSRTTAISQHTCWNHIEMSQSSAHTRWTYPMFKSFDVAFREHHDSEEDHPGRVLERDKPLCSGLSRYKIWIQTRQFNKYLPETIFWTFFCSGLESK